MLFEIFSAFFGVGGLAPIKTKKAKIAGRVRRQAIWVRLSSAYIARTLLEAGTAERMAEELESAILSLEQMPERGAIRRTGVYATGEYRQLFVKNYVIIYRVKKSEKQVYVVTVRYAPSSF